MQVRPRSSRDADYTIDLTETMGTIAEAQERADAILRKRAQYVGPNVALNYATPLHIVRGEGCFLYDGAGRQYLDCVNNVAHVGHCHPEVVAATCSQLATLNTNCRYLHDNYTDYSQALTSTMPDPLEVVYMVCSVSEANDLALRIARAATGGATHVAVIDGAYHGHVGSLIDISPYKFDNPGGSGAFGKGCLVCWLCIITSQQH